MVRGDPLLAGQPLFLALSKRCSELAFARPARRRSTRSGDREKNLIAVKKGFGSMRLVESVKRCPTGPAFTAEEVDALINIQQGD